MKPLVAAVAVLVALAASAPVRAQTPAIDAVRARAEQGDAAAQYNLGQMYSYGRVLPKDSAEAVRWYRLAAEQGHDYAQLSLGRMYADGTGVPQDDVEAVRWYGLAAEQGNYFAMSNLGAMYLGEGGVPQDYVQAHMWLNLAASRATGGTRESAVQGRDLVASRLTPDDLSEAQRLAREWDAAHPR